MAVADRVPSGSQERVLLAVEEDVCVMLELLVDVAVADDVAVALAVADADRVAGGSHERVLLAVEEDVCVVLVVAVPVDVADEVAEAV